MNYVSGLMLGASLANMLRQTLGGAGDPNAMGGMRGGRGMQGGAMGGFSMLSGGGRGASSFLPSGLLGAMGRSGGTSFLPTGLFGAAGKQGGLAGLLPSAGTAERTGTKVQRVSDPAALPFTCVHASPGRRRYRTPYLTPEFAAVLEECLVRLPFVISVRANAVAGSILLTYLPEDEAHILVLAEGLEEIFSEGRTTPPPATLAQSVRRSVHDFSGWIQRHTGGALDLSSVLAGVFVLRGIRQLVMSSSTPSGSQMLWWALTLMRGWRI